MSESDEKQSAACLDRVGLTNPSPLTCPCGGCGGRLVEDGRNRDATIHFVICKRCGCTHTISAKGAQP